jgi:glycosyltransferase involved in cell wall biosynthesis
MITVYTLAHNEELLIQFMIDHYRERFPSSNIVLYDNQSTDNTVQIARDNACGVVEFNTNNKYHERRQMEIRNECFKGALTDWVLVCDMDELLDINEQELKDEIKSGSTIIRTEVYDMINRQNNADVLSMKHAVKSPLLGKLSLFNKKYIKEMNYGPGSHSCNPLGTAVYSKKVYKMYHYNSLGEDITIKKFKERKARMSKDSMENGWGSHYFMKADEIREEYSVESKKAKKIR